MKIVKCVLAFLITLPVFGALNVPITLREALFPGDNTGHTDTVAGGIARTNEPFCTGVPIADASAIANTNSLGLTGASAGQFRIIERWPSTNAKAIKVCGILASLSAGGTATVTLTDSGSGNFGGPTMGVDPGGASSIAVTTGASTLTIKKANFNIIDQEIVGGITIISSGASSGFTLLGPDETAAYPGNVTCLPTSGGTACTTVFTSANDPSSTSSIEENGPVMTVIKSSGNFIDGAGHIYMHFTSRMFFYLNKNYVKVQVALRNADYGTASTFNTAVKGYQGLEARLLINNTGTSTMNYTIANHTVTPTTGTLNQSVGTDYVYLYQASSTLMTNNNNSCVSVQNVHDPAGICTPESLLSGYSIIGNGSPITTGTSAQYPQGWADIRDSNGAGVEIGQYELAAYGNKSLEIRGGGRDVRIGLWASENNTTSTSTTTANKPYYMQWPQWSNVQEGTFYLNFHSTANVTLANDFLKLQHYLIGTPTSAYYNTTNVLVYPLPDNTQEDNYYKKTVFTANPAVTAPTLKDFGIVDTFNWGINAWRYYYWNAGGVSNQMEFRLSQLYLYIKRGFTGQYLDAVHFYYMAASNSFPMSDGFNWRDKGASEVVYWDWPQVAYNLQIGNCSGSSASCLTSRDWIGSEHAYGFGMIEFYLMTGDEFIKDAVIEGPKDYILDTTSTNNQITQGKLFNNRAVGVMLMWIARMHNFLLSISDSDAAAVATQGTTIYTEQIQPDLCAYNGFPTGCTVNTAPASGQQGVSRVRGVAYAWGDSIQMAGCGSNPPQTQSVRDAAIFMDGILLEGMWELRQEQGSGWAYYNQIFDLGYGIVQHAFGEMQADDGSFSWLGNTGSVASGPLNGMRYKESIDYANNCNVGAGGAPAEFYFMVQNPNAAWPIWYFKTQYEGGANQQEAEKKFNFELQTVINGGSAIKDELYRFTIGQVVDSYVNPVSQTLTTIACGSIVGQCGNSYINGTPSPAFTSFVNNGGGSYTLTWPVTSGATSYRIKWGTKTIVDWIGFDAGTYQFIGDPTTTMNWFAATDASGIPTPPTNTITISTGNTSLTAKNFMVKAYVTLGTTPALNTWTALTSGYPGWHAQILNYDKSEYVPTHHAHCNFGAYKDGANNSSENNDAMICYSYNENRYLILDHNGYWHSTHAGVAGHTVSIFAYMSQLDTIAYQTDGSGSNSPEQNQGFWWWWDVGGAAGQAHEPTGTGVNGTVRGWLGVVTPLNEMMVWEPVAQKLIFYDINGRIEVCDPYTNTCIFPTISVHTPVTNRTSPNMVYNALDGKVYLWAGAVASIETFQCSTNACTTAVGALLTTTCVGADCVGAAPSIRLAAGMAFSPRDNIFLAGGGIPNNYTCNTDQASPAPAACALNDTWTFNSITNVWTEQFPANTYPASRNYFTADRITYDWENNVFLNETINGFAPTLYAYAVSTPLPVGRISNTYTTTPGSLNYATNTGGPTQSNQSWAYDPVVISSGVTGYFAWIETGVDSDASNCGSTHHAYIQSLTSNAWTYYPSGTLTQRCVALDPLLPPSNVATDGSRVQLTVANGTLWETHERNNHNIALYTRAYANQWTGAAWSGGEVGCVAPVYNRTNAKLISIVVASNVATANVTKDPTGLNGTIIWVSGATVSPALNGRYLLTSANLTFTTSGVPDGTYTESTLGIANCNNEQRQAPIALITNGTTPTAAFIEWTATTAYFTQEGYLTVQKWNGTNWQPVGPNTASGTILNINAQGTGTRVTGGDLSSDGTNPAACWSEEVLSSRSTISTSPQIQCAQWNGTSWVRFGSSSLNFNQSTTTSWAYQPSMTYVGGKFYITWAERTITAGNQKVFVCRWDGASCTSLGGGPLNIVATGWADHPKLSNDGTNVYLTWSEQPRIGAKAQLYVKKWTGASPWVLLGGTLNTDPINDSVQDPSIAVINGTPTVIWTEISWGNLRQVYSKQWDGTTWNLTGPQVSTPSIQTNSPLPQVTVGFSYSQTITATGGTLPYTWSVIAGALPTGMSLNPSTGVISGTPTIAATSTFTIQVSDNAAITNTKVFSITVNVLPTVSTNSVPGGTTGVVYSPQQMTNAGGTAPFTWSISAGALPTGLSISSAGVISGTPTHAASYSFTVKVTDVNGAQATKIFSSVVIISNLTVTTLNPMTSGTTSVAYSQQLNASGGSGAYGWSVISGALPTGLSLAGNLISGTPTVANTFNFTVQVTDAGANTATKALSITIVSGGAALSIVSTSPLPSGSINIVYTPFTFVAAGGTTPYTWTITAGSIPGLSLSSAGVLTGTPTTANTYNITVKVTDAVAANVSVVFSITIVPNIPGLRMKGDIGASGTVK